MLKVTASVSAIFEGLVKLGCTVLEEDVTAIEKMVVMLNEKTEVELSNSGGKITMSFDFDISDDVESLSQFVKTEEALGFDVFVSEMPSKSNPALNNIVLKKATAMSTSTDTLQAQLTAAIAASNAATAEAVNVTKAFLAAIKHSETTTDQVAKDAEASAAAVQKAIEAMAKQTADAAERLEKATAAATEQAEKSADRAASMADAVNAQRKAREQANKGPTWYTSTPAKAVGAVVVVAAVAAGAYYGWKAYNGAGTAAA